MAIRIPNIPKSEFVELLNEWVMGANAQRNIEITKTRLFIGLSLEEVADKYGLEKRQVSNIVRDCVNKVNAHIK